MNDIRNLGETKKVAGARKGVLTHPSHPLPMLSLGESPVPTPAITGSLVRSAMPRPRTTDGHVGGAASALVNDPPVRLFQTSGGRSHDP
jgi:hypothetical protein